MRVILDAGICTINKKINFAPAGAKPVFTEQPLTRCWYGVLNHEVTPDRPTGNREEVHTDLRVRILQNRRVDNHCVVIAEGIRYEVTRVYHSRDDYSGELISDLNLAVIEP
ncbi:MAG: hypothetical protein MJZ85_10370 [Bacteroidales bacterium]|nr:hypothetical protein [Bacteroidales bacterium]